MIVVAVLLWVYGVLVRVFLLPLYCFYFDCLLFCLLVGVLSVAFGLFGLVLVLCGLLVVCD